MSNQQLTSDEQVVKLIAHLIALLQRLGGALSTTHARGIVHGALVSGNLLLDKKDHLWVADFGLARLSPPLSPYLAPELQPTSIAYAHSTNRAAYWDAVTPASDQ